MKRAIRITCVAVAQAPAGRGACSSDRGSDSIARRDAHHSFAGFHGRIARFRAIVFISFFSAAVVGPEGSLAGAKAFFTYQAPSSSSKIHMYDATSDTLSTVFSETSGAWEIGRLAVGNDRLFFSYQVSSSSGKIHMYDAASDTLSTVFSETSGAWEIGSLAVGNDKLFFSYQVPSSSGKIHMYDAASDTLSTVFSETSRAWEIGGLAVTPEPATLSLLTIGGLTLLRRRRKR